MALLLIWFAPFAPIVVPAIMGIIVWIERRRQLPLQIAKSRNRLTVNPFGLSSRPIGSAVDTPVPVQHPFKLRHLFGCWSLLTWLTLPLIPYAHWWTVSGHDFLLVIHPVFCVGWWLTLRRRGVTHASVYALSAWTLAYVIAAAVQLAPVEWIQWGSVGEPVDSDDFPVIVGYMTGIAGPLEVVLWLLYIASGLACIGVSVGFSMMTNPPIRPMAIATAWIPMACGVWIFGMVFGIMAALMSVGVAGYGISREMRRRRDESGMFAEAPGDERVVGFPNLSPRRLILQAAVAAAIAAVLSIVVRAWGLVNLTFESTFILIMAAFGLMGAVGYVISRELNSRKNRLETSDGPPNDESRLEALVRLPRRLMVRVAVVVAITVTLSIAVRESGLFNLVVEVVFMWSMTLVATAVCVWMLRRRNPNLEGLALVVCSFLAVIAANAFGQLFVESVQGFSAFVTAIGGTEEEFFEQTVWAIWTIPSVSAVTVGLTAAWLLLRAVNKGILFAYGAMLLGFIWVPIALYSTAVHSNGDVLFRFVDARGLAAAVVIGCVILFVMWRYLGPGAIDEEPREGGGSESG